MPQASAAHKAPKTVAMVKNAKPTAMDLYITSSNTSNEGNLALKRLRPSKIPATIKAEIPK
jgi:hypothetical protein